MIITADTARFVQEYNSEDGNESICQAVSRCIYQAAKEGKSRIDYECDDFEMADYVMDIFHTARFRTYSYTEDPFVVTIEW